ncbi:MAG TPA: NADH-quinone oxidoreductase subunit M [Leptolinea sp.]
MHLSVLTFIIALPLLTGIVILLLPETEKKAPRMLALISGLITLGLSLWTYINYDIAAGGYQFVEKADWLPALGISYHVGVDGISLPLILLAGIVTTCGTAISWNIEERPREFFSFLMFLAASVFGVFCSLDVFLLFFFFELAVFPKYLMILIWGSPQTREYGAMKLTLYLFLGSVVALVGVLAMVFTSGANTFDMLALEKAGFAADFQRLWFPFVFFGFAVLGGLFPFHSWAPDGHVAAPTAVSMLLAGVEMKVGAFAALRVGIMLLPEGAKSWAFIIMGLAVVNVVYGALIALVQTDFKYVIGFSSVSHMGLVMIGFAALNREGLLGAGMQMFSHGVMTALFFAIVGMVYDRTHTRDISKLGGLVKKMPLAAFGFIVSGLVSMGMPGFSGFIAEFPIFMGAWKAAPLVAIISVLGIIITAGYILLVVRRVFFGDLPDAYADTIGDVSLMDKLTIGLLSLIMIAIGILPSLMVPMVSSGVDHILILLGGR